MLPIESGIWSGDKHLMHTPMHDQAITTETKVYAPLSEQVDRLVTSAATYTFIYVGGLSFVYVELHV